MKYLNSLTLLSILLFAFGMSSHLSMNAQDCISGALIFESNINDGGPQQISYNLSNTDTFEMIEAGGMGLGNNEAQSISFCIPEGCYTLVVQGNAEALNSGFFNAEIQLGGAVLSPEISIFGGTIYYEFCTTEGFVSCPQEIEVMPSPNPCGAFVFAIPSYENHPGISWFLPDGSVFIGGGVVEYAPEMSGQFEVCAALETPNCPNGVELCASFVSNCLDDCEFSISSEVTNNGNFIFSAENILGAPLPGLTYSWFVDGELIETNEGIFFDYSWDDCELHEVGLLASSEFCSSEVSIFVEGAGCENNCPQEIAFGNDGCNYWFEVGSAWPNESVTWYIGGLVFEGGHYFTYNNDGFSGEEVITAVINNGECEGYQVSTWINFDDDCGCSSAFEYMMSDNGQLMAYPLEAYDPGIYYSWVLDGQWFEGSQYEIAADLECGTHELCLYMESGNCLSNTCQDINVDCANCDLNLVALMDNCAGFFYIENPGVSEILWFTENGSVLSGNEVVIEFENDGPHIICVNAILPGCGLLDACITVESEFCDEACTPVSFAMDSFVGEGGPTEAYMNIINQDGQFWSLVASYTENNTFFDGELCLPDGCYEVLIDTPIGTDNPDAFFSAAFVDGQELEFTHGPTWNGVVYEYGFALNSDCGTDECNLAIDLISQNGNAYLFTAETDVWAEGISWFVDGEFVEMSANFDVALDPGQHEVCAMIETPACPEGVWSCLEIMVDEDEICVPILFQISVDGELLEDLLISYNAESLLGSIEGELLLSSIQGEASVLACVPEGCYNLTLGMEEGVLIPLLLNTFIDGEFSFDYVIDPLAQTMSIEFGVNTECSNTISENTEKQDLLIYPVPADQVLNVVLPENTAGAVWEIMNANGQLVASGVIQQVGLNRFDIADFAAGVYHFQVRILDNNEFDLLQKTWIVTH